MRWVPLSEQYYPVSIFVEMDHKSSGRREAPFPAGRFPVLSSYLCRIHSLILNRRRRMRPKAFGDFQTTICMNMLLSHVTLCSSHSRRRAKERPPETAGRPPERSPRSGSRHQVPQRRFQGFGSCLSHPCPSRSFLLFQYIHARLGLTPPGRKNSRPSGRLFLLSSVLLLPFLQRLQLLVKPQVTFMAAPGDFSRPQGFQYGAALLFWMAAAHETAIIQVGTKFLKCLRQAVLQLQIQLLRFKGGKAR